MIKMRYKTIPSVAIIYKIIDILTIAIKRVIGNINYGEEIARY